ncbi:MAG: hypothetical protein K0V04_29020 [Deltaproteobacteria bacterium]|nr:hypothetical protein [Deltaproteobacteria bacterium]
MSAQIEFGALGGAIPLLQAAVSDERVQVVTLGVDRKWRYQHIASRCTAGWNPFCSEVYVSVNSALDGYCRQPGADVRDHNENDDLASEAAFMAHDYLHIWSLHELRDIDASLLPGAGQITADNLEANVAWMLATEAVATVGLDYWFLSQRGFRDRLDAGSLLTTLTVSYESSMSREYHQYRPDLEVMSPGFLSEIATFYCHGAFAGFSVSDVRRSPATLRWLRHEVSYGEKQRIYTRQWLRHLAGLPPVAIGRLGGPVQLPSRFEDVLAELGRRLWRLVVEGDGGRRPTTVDREAWRGAPREFADFRYDNVLAMSPDELAKVVKDGAFERVSAPYLVEQILRARRCPDDEPSQLAMGHVVGRGEPSLALWAAQQLPPLEHPHATCGPRELFILG